MTYRDLLSKPNRREIYPKVLAWSANYETGVFPIDEPIHPQAKWIWFQIMPYRTDCSTCYMDARIEKYQHINGRWERVEKNKGTIPLVNYNPFAPHELSCSSKQASVFPQNQ